MDVHTCVTQNHCITGLSICTFDWLAALVLPPVVYLHIAGLHRERGYQFVCTVNALEQAIMTLAQDNSTEYCFLQSTSSWCVKQNTDASLQAMVSSCAAAPGFIERKDRMWV